MNSDLKPTGDMEMGMATGGDGSSAGLTRSRSFSEKGLHYQLELKVKTLKREYRQLRAISNKLLEIMDSDVTENTVRQIYSDWLTNYEQFLCVRGDIVSLPCDFEHEYAEMAEDIEEMETYMKTIKKSTEQWFKTKVSKRQPFQRLTDTIEPHDSVSRSGTKSSRSSRASFASSLASARLKEEQKKAELMARSSALTKKRELQLANVKLKLEEEELDLHTQMAVADAKTRVIDEFQKLEIENRETKPNVTSGVLSNVSRVKSTSMTNDMSNVKKSVQLNPSCNTFVPVSSGINANDSGRCYDTNVSHNLNAVGNHDYVSGNNSVSARPKTKRTHRADSTIKTVTSPCQPTTQYSGMINPQVATQGDALQSVVRQLRKPVPEIRKFSGDVLEYRKFLRQFETKIVVNAVSEDEKLAYLEQFTSGEANRIVSGYTYMDSESGYEAAVSELNARYGRQDVMANAFVKRALAWPEIKADNVKGLDDYAIFLAECSHAITCIEAVRVLEYPDNLRKLVAKLPYYCHEKWRNLIQRCRAQWLDVSFQQLADFVRDEAIKATDPVFGRDAMSVESNKAKCKRGQQSSHRARTVFSTTQSPNSSSDIMERNLVTKETKDISVSLNDGKLNKSPNTTCEYCQTASHAFYCCNKFKALAIQDRVSYLKSKGLCYGCFRRGHLRSECQNKALCLICQGRHPTSMHTDKKRETETKADYGSRDSSIKAYSNFSRHANSDNGTGNGMCTMAIVPVRVRMKGSVTSIETYAFLDPGSSICFCTEKLMGQLGAQGSKMNITLDTMAEPFKMTTNVISNMEIGDLQFSTPITLQKVYSKDRIPVSRAHIPTNEDISRWDHLKGIHIPELNSDIGLLIGNNIPDAYTPIDVRAGQRGSPHAVHTHLGWVVWNLIRHTEDSVNCCVFPVNRAEVIERLDDTKRLESLIRSSVEADFPERINDQTAHPSQEDRRFLQMVNETITLVDGHYQMCLPFKNPHVCLPNNLAQAEQRLNGLRKKMIRNPTFHKDYSNFMNNIIDCKYAEKVPDSEIDRNDGKVWYTHHHGVYHPRKPNSIRVVFDCAAQFAGVSLNGLLLQGPNLTNSLMGVLMRFRQEHVAIMADIKSMFFQVRVQKEDADYLRFLWWPDGDLAKEPECYRMVVHLFGATSSPSCCNVALQRTAQDNMCDFSSAATDMIFRHFYVDDCLKSIDSVDQAISLVQEVSELCHKGGFHLTKWSSNSHRVLEAVPPEERAKEVKTIDLQKDTLPNERALGVHWTVQEDSFGFDISLQDRSPTRRGILSVTSSVYDPFGVSAPFILQAKQLLQELCRSGLDWDQEISGSNLQKWQQWLEDLPSLQKISLPRCYKPNWFGDVSHAELHIFSDACEKGYGIVAYLRLVDHRGNIHCAFVVAKSRVVPLKKVTIPRLELTAATVAAKFSVMIKRELEYELQEVRFWTDSQAVLNYISSDTGRFHTFVANRLTIIQEISTPCQWTYVGTKVNPADVASRGQDMKSFLTNESWLNGPSFLWKPQSEWPTSNKPYETPDDDPEVKRVSATTVTVEKSDVLQSLIDHHSSWWRLRRVVGWILQGMSNLRQWANLRREVTDEVNRTESDPSSRQALVHKRMQTVKIKHQTEAVHKVKALQLKSEHLGMAKTVLICHVQKTCFAEDIQCLTVGGSKAGDRKCLKKNNPISKLDPFVADGILRVGGRLSRADILYDAKYPILLPKKSPLSRMILQDLHKSSGHMGKSFMVNRSREEFWIIGANSLVKSILSKCVTCRKYYSKRGEQKMADLPVDRITPHEPPFSRVGVDYFGPFDVKRGRSTVKRYGVLFTCLATRAVHIEVAFSLETTSCINAIRRFMARRGNVKRMYSDNGTNLVGSQRELKAEIDNWNQTHLVETLQQRGIEWHFNPPTGSHFGGIWERMIRSIRKVMYGLLHERMVRLDDESLGTLFCEVEAILNSRPLTEMPSSPSDNKAITPNDLLLLHQGTSLPPGVFDENDCYSTRRWRHVQHLADVFWKRWVREYLPLLQLRQKWTQPHRNVAVNDLVLLVDNTPRSSWALGRVIHVFKDSKGFVRMVKVKTQSNVLIRPVDKLCLVLEAD